MKSSSSSQRSLSVISPFLPLFCLRSTKPLLVRKRAEINAATCASASASSKGIPSSIDFEVRSSTSSFRETGSPASERNLSDSQVLFRSPSRSSICRLPLNLSLALSWASRLSLAISSRILCSAANLPASCKPLVIRQE